MTRQPFSLLCLALIGALCSCSSGKESSSTGGNTGGTNTPLGAIPGDPNGTPLADNGPNTFATGPSLAPDSSYIHYFGRQQPGAAGGVKLSWPGSGFNVRVTGASKINISMLPNQYGENNVMGVLIDGSLSQKLALSDASTSYIANIPSGEHIVSFVKRTEAGNGEVLVNKLETDGQFEVLAAPSGRLIEIIGENAATGYSADGTNGVTTCSQPINSVADPAQQNAAATFGALTAKSFNADYSILAWSGRGLKQNYEGSVGTSMLSIYDRLDPRDISSAITKNIGAQAVVINVGTNDINYWLQNKDGVAADIPGFTAAYVALIQKVRGLNPSANIFATVGPTLGNFQCLGADPNASYQCGTNGTSASSQGLLNVLTKAIQAAIAQANVSQVTFLAFTPDSTNVAACYQPSAQGHQAMAATLIPAIAQALNWQANTPATAQPKAAERGKGPTVMTGNFVPRPDVLGNANSIAEGVTNKEFPQCHYCSPRGYNKAAVGTSACPTLVGTSQPCLSYCHVPDGFAEAHHDNPPTSGNHYATPAVNTAPYTSAVPRGRYIHAQEHGAIVIMYNCPNNSCPDELTKLNSLYSQRNLAQGATAKGVKNVWLILTPDPLLPTKFGAATWTWSYTSDTLDLDAINCFIDQHMFWGRECTTHDTSGCSPLLDKPMSTVTG